MRSIIQQSVVLPATPEELWEMYLDPETHAAFTGDPVTIGREPRSPFRAFKDMLSGEILAVVRPTLIVQSWRSALFHDDDIDSTLILAFTDEGNGGRIDLVHLDVPDHDYEGVIVGWEKFYWTPWKQYLETR